MGSSGGTVLREGGHRAEVLEDVQMGTGRGRGTAISPGPIPKPQSEHHRCWKHKSHLHAVGR